MLESGWGACGVSPGDKPGHLGESQTLEGLCSVKGIFFFSISHKQLGTIKVSKQGNDWEDLSFLAKSPGGHVT